MTTMTDFYQRPEIGEIRVKDGVEMIFEACGRCLGSGQYPSSVDNGRCFDCRATYRGRPISTGGFWVTKTDYDRRAHNRDLAAARRERKAAAEAAELPGKVTAFVTANPLMAELLKLEDYSGFLGSLRSQLEKKGSLSDKQVAIAARIIIEDAEREAHIENSRRSRVDAPIGEIGERRDFTGKVVWIQHELNPFSYYESYTTSMIVATDEGAIKWKSSKQVNVERGEQVTIKATVKSHDADGNGRIITIVTRGKIVD